MSELISEYVQKLGQAWQAEICTQLAQVVHQAVPEATERLQYGKPHYLKNGKYTAVIGTSKDAVSFTIFNAANLEVPDGLFEAGPQERKTLKIRQGHAVDYPLLIRLLQQAASSL